MVKTLPLLILISLVSVLALVVPSCQPATSVGEEQKLQLIEEIKAFEKRLGFAETENFRTYSPELGAYDYLFFTPSTQLPYSLDDPALVAAIGTRDSVSLDYQKYDAFFYSIPSVAGEGTPLTESLLQVPLHRFIQIIFHEDWHEQIDLPHGLEEPSAEIIGYTAAMLFCREKYGQDSQVYRTLQKHLDNKLRESQVYGEYYDKLIVLYAKYHEGKLSELDTLIRKARLLESMGNELYRIWGGRPDQLNNAFIAFQMTYLRHLPLMHEVLQASDFDLTKTIRLFLAMPEQGTGYDSLEQVKGIEASVAAYLSRNL
jgi:hypothetical protein